MKCSWSGDDFLEVDLHHCDHPVNYHIFFKSSDSSPQNLTLKQGDEQKLYESKGVSVTLEVTKLERMENKVTTTVSTIPSMLFLKLMKKIRGPRNHFAYTMFITRN